jgi:hypothetical protein
MDNQALARIERHSIVTSYECEFGAACLLISNVEVPGDAETVCPLPSVPNTDWRDDSVAGMAMLMVGFGL